MTGALEGVTVLEFASYISGPYAGMLLADMGAEVIKIEAPGRGDPFREWADGGHSVTFEALNRNKKSVALDLKAADGRRDAARLAATADVLVENYRPGALDRAGLGYDALAAANPRLIYCSITGFGATGPYSDWPGYDTVGQGMGGLLSLLTDFDDPRPVGYAFSDHLAGASAYQGVLAALFARERTGRGQRVETSLLEATVALIGENAARYFHDGKVPGRADRIRIAQVFAFPDRDGRPFVVHLSSPPKFWQGLLCAVERSEWAEDDRFRTRPDRIRNYDALHAELRAVFRTGSRDDWLARLRDNDVPAGPLNTLAEVFEDPQVAHLGLRRTIAHPVLGTVDLVGTGIRLGDTPGGIRAPAPALGEHNEALLGAPGPRTGA